MTPLQKALSLSEIGMHVFPAIRTEDNRKIPLTPRGHLDATRDPNLIDDFWREHPEAGVGVWTGASGIVVLDVDMKEGVDGQESLDRAWLYLPESFQYETPGGGYHVVYTAPSGVNLGPASKYRKMEGVDRRGGSSWCMWYGDVPAPERILAAPAWLCDEATPRSAAEFEGDVSKWYAHITPGEPNALVRRAMSRVKTDYSHSEMVEAQYEAVRLGAEGNPGVVQLLEALEKAWLERDPANHKTPVNEWEYKFQEALQSGVEKYGAQTDSLANLPAYSLTLVPKVIPDALLSGPGDPLDNGQWSRLLGTLVDAIDDDLRVASILWNAPKPSVLSREWGLDFIVNTRIPEARRKPEPTRENPALEAERQRALESPVAFQGGRSLLTDDEREWVQHFPTFVDVYLRQGQLGGFANPIYFRVAAWSIASMVFAFRGFIPVTATDKMGLNLWSMILGYSGTGKSRAIMFRDAVMRAYFGMEDGEQPYNLGADSSPEGLMLGLLQRDKQASFFGQDEGSGFFKKLAAKDWMTGLDDSLSRWYEGWVDPSSKISLRDYRGKSALTSFHIQFFATPNRLTDVLTREMFLSGFLARMSWSVGEPPIKTRDRFRMLEQVEVADDFDETPEPIRELVADLMHAASIFEHPTPILSTPEARVRMERAYEHMHDAAESDENWDVVEPSITRLAETMRKCAAITAMYRGSATIELCDALVAIQAVEEWYTNLFVVADMITSGAFQRDVESILQWIKNKGGRATRAAIFHQFRNMVVRDPRELETRLQFLLESGAVNREEVPGGGPSYRVNGG